MSDESPTPALREPSQRVCRRAVTYWRVNALIGTVVATAIGVVVWILVPSWPWWATAIAAVVGLWCLVELLVAPTFRYRIHRWEVDDIAVHTREGWLSLETRIAPLNRVQTVDSNQGPVMRLFRLASLTVTTASAAGPITIDGLDQDEAKRLVALLTRTTAAVEGDAT